MDLKKLLWFILTVLTFQTQAQHSGKSPSEVANDLQNLVMHAAGTARHYFFYMQGVDPLTTSKNLDNALALTESDLIQLENFANNHNEYLPYWNKISGYWYNVRYRCAHSPVKKTGQYIFEHINSIKKLSDDWRSQLNSGSNTNSLDEFVYRTQFVALLFALKIKNKQPVYTKWLNVELESYKNRIQNLPKVFSGLSVSLQEQNQLYNLLNDYVAELSAETPDPQAVYELSEQILQRLKTYY